MNVNSLSKTGRPTLSKEKEALFAFLSVLAVEPKVKYLAISARDGLVYGLLGEPVFLEMYQCWGSNSGQTKVLCRTNLTELARQDQLVDVMHLQEWREQQKLREEELNTQSPYQKWLRSWQSELFTEYLVLLGKTDEFESYCQTQFDIHLATLREATSCPDEKPLWL